MRAVSQDETGAQMAGIGLNRIFVLTMGLSCGLAALAGAALLSMYPSFPDVGMQPLYLAWYVVILAGLGNVQGAIIGAFIVALLQTLAVNFVGLGWVDVLPTAFIILILLFKPSGLFGSEVKGRLGAVVATEAATTVAVRTRFARAVTPDVARSRRSRSSPSPSCSRSSRRSTARTTPRYLVSAAFMAAMAIAFDFTAGYINIVNFGFAAFVGVGAYTSGLLAVELRDLALDRHVRRCRHRRVRRPAHGHAHAPAARASTRRS